MPEVAFRRRRACAVIIARCVGEVESIIANLYFRPLTCRALIIYARQAVATIERLIIDRSYAVGDDYTRQAGAIIERIITDRSYAVADNHARQAGAIKEHLITDRSYAIADDYTRQTVAIIERLITDRIT